MSFKTPTLSANPLPSPTKPIVHHARSLGNGMVILQPMSTTANSRAKPYRRLMPISARPPKTVVSSKISAVPINPKVIPIMGVTTHPRIVIPSFPKTTTMTASSSTSTAVLSVVQAPISGPGAVPNPASKPSPVISTPRSVPNPEPGSSSSSSSITAGGGDKRKRLFSKELRCMMYGFGDDVNPYTETVDLLEDLVLHFIGDISMRALNFGDTDRIAVEDLLFILRKDAKKYARLKDLLDMNHELRQARKAFDEVKYIES